MSDALPAIATSPSQASPRSPRLWSLGARCSGRDIGGAIYAAAVRSFVTGRNHSEGWVSLVPSPLAPPQTGLVLRLILAILLRLDRLTPPREQP